MLCEEYTIVTPLPVGVDPLDVEVQVTWVPGFKSTATQAIQGTWADLLQVTPVQGKAHSPCLIPSTFKAEAIKWNKTGRPAKTEAVSFTALIFDFDSQANAPEWKQDRNPQVDAVDIENWLGTYGLAGIYWTTWKACHGALRWRLVLPLDQPYSAKAQEESWKFWAKRLEAEVGRVDWSPRGVTSLHALPAFPENKVIGHDEWGGIVPDPIGVEGRLLSLEEAEAKANQHHYANSLKRVAARKGEAWAKAKGPKSKPYKGNPTAPAVASTLAIWAETRGVGSKGTTDFTAALDAIEALRATGLKARLRSRQGSVLYAAWWNMWRMGFTVKEVSAHLEPLVEQAGEKYVREFLGHASHFGKLEGADTWATQVLQSLADVPTGTFKAAFEQFVRVFSRAAHLRSLDGGALSGEQIAKVLGISIKHFVFWRSKLEEAGFVGKSGENVNRRYTIIDFGGAQ